MSYKAAVDIARVLLLVTVVASATSLSVYSATARWWRTIMGRAIIIEQSCMGLSIGYLAARIFWPGATPVWVALTIYGLIALGQCAFAVSLVLSWRQSSKFRNGGGK